MKIEFTPEQKDAINARGKDIIVSAAAGSGKTATLTERIIQRLCDTTSPGDISKMLIVTFTKAAAGDMKRKISEALSAAVAKNPKNKHLRRQKIKLQSAKISTIHSFYFDLIRSNFERLGISPAARIADDEAKTLALEVMRDEINKRVLLVNDNPKDNPNDNPNDNPFDNLCEVVSGGYFDKLPENLVAIYNKLSSFPEGVEFAKNSAERVLNLTCESFFTKSEGKEIVAYFKGFFSHYENIFKAMTEDIAKNEPVNKSYGKSFCHDYNFICEILEIEDPNLLLRALSGYDKINLGRLSGEYKDEKVETYVAIRKKFHEDMAKQKSFGIDINYDEFPEYCRQTYSYLSCLYDILKSFERKFGKEKTKLGILDYSDAERLCLALLQDEDGNKTPAADEISSIFDEIYIDEYQDVNQIQEKIFSIISSENRFMVGDVKQSIYGFRGSCPEIFSAYRKKFTAFNSDVLNKEATGYKIFMSDNFRCDKGIIDFSNEIFKKLFPISRYIDFCDEDNLKHGKVHDNAAEKVELAIFDKDYKEETEAAFVAKRIKAYIKEGRKPSDIAVLMRSKSKLKELEAEFEKQGITADIQKTENFFEKSEILLLMSLLNCIDNPTREIWLAGALRSPVFGFTLDEIFEIKNYRKKDNEEISDIIIDEDTSLFYNFCLFTEQTQSNKGRIFLNWLSECRKKEREMSVEKLVSFVIESCFLMPMVLKTEDGEERKQAVLRFMELASSFVSSGGTTLCNFMRNINEAVKTGSLPIDKESAGSEDKVKVMTVHISKGQEFPICFLYACGSKFNKKDKSAPLIIDNELGIGIKLRSGGGLVNVETPLFRNVSIRTDDKNIDEEMRILYVALTRAREKLIISGKTSSALEKTVRECRFESDYITPYLLSKRSSFLEWILLCNPTMVSIKINGENENDNPIQNVEVVKKTDVNCNEVNKRYSFIKERLSYTYPYSVASSLPAKISVSELYPSLLDDVNSDVQSLTQETEDVNFLPKKPQFMMESIETEPKATEKGVATHVFMQFCNFDNCIQKGIDFEISRLVDNSFITRMAAEIIDTYAVGKFFQSELFSSMKKAKKLSREARFNVKLPAQEFTTDENLREQIGKLNESIFVQGVIDCYFYDENDNLCIVDYKTDHFPKKLLTGPEKVKNMLKNRHSLQLGYYKKALEIITKVKVEKVFLYSFALNEAIDMSDAF